MKVMLLWPAADYSTKDVAVGIKKALIEAGVEVVDYHLQHRLNIAFRALGANEDGEGGIPGRVLSDIALLASEPIVFQAVMHQVDWVLGIHGVGVHPAALEGLRRAGIKLAWWFTEAPYESNDSRELHFATYVDVAFVNERTSVGLFQDVLDRSNPGAAAYYLRHAYDPAVHYPRGPEVTTDAEKCDVLFIGTGFVERLHLLECCDWTGINLVLGGLWPGLQQNYRLAAHVKYPPMQNGETVRLYSGAKIIINAHRDGGAKAESANPRVWEVAACGVYQVCDRRQEAIDVLGDSVGWYDAGVPWQFITTIRRALADDEMRQRCAADALARVQGETFAARASTMIAVLGEHSTAARAVRVPALAGVA